MCAYSKNYKRENLLHKKQNVINSLQWAIMNNDKELAEECDKLLKIILKQLNKLEEQ